MSDRTGGIISFVVDGVQLEVEGSFTFNAQAFQRTSVVGVTGFAGHKREGVIPFFEGVCFYKQDVSVTTLSELENITAQLDLYNGKKLVLEGASQVGQLEVDAVEGTFTLRLEGKKGREL
jgi:hypothetical protein